MFNWYNPKPEAKPTPGLKAKTAPPPLSPMYVLQFFAYTHLSEPLQDVSRPFSELANQIANVFPGNPEAASALRKLLEAKDCAVRAALMHPSLSNFDKAWNTFQEREEEKRVRDETKTKG